MKLIRRRTVIYLILVNLFLLATSNQIAAAVMPSAQLIVSTQSSNAPHPLPSPSPGPSPTPSAFIEQSLIFSSMNFVKPVVTALQVSIVNRATGTPGILEGPRLAVANIGGYGQIIPTVSTIIKNNLPVVAIVLRGLLQFGAAS